MEVQETKVEEKVVEEKKENFFVEILKASLIALVIVVPIRVFIAQPYIVSGSSMDNTFKDGHYIIVDQLTYRFDNPERGDVIIFKYPKDPSKYFIKRIVGMPGETIRIEMGVITIINKENPDGFIYDEPYLTRENRTIDTLERGLKDDQYFVLGDNRKASSDSRIWGPLDEEFIVGRAIIRVLPVTEVGIFPGDYSTDKSTI